MGLRRFAEYQGRKSHKSRYLFVRVSAEESVCAQSLTRGRENAEDRTCDSVDIELSTCLVGTLDDPGSSLLRVEGHSIVDGLLGTAHRVDKEFVRCTMLGVKSQYFSKGEILIRRRGCEGWAVSTLYDGEGLR